MQTFKAPLKFWLRSVMKSLSKRFDYWKDMHGNTRKYMRYVNRLSHIWLSPFPSFLLIFLRKFEINSFREKKQHSLKQLDHQKETKCISPFFRASNRKQPFKKPEKKHLSAPKTPWGSVCTRYALNPLSKHFGPFAFRDDLEQFFPEKTTPGYNTKVHSAADDGCQYEW